MPPQSGLTAASLNFIAPATPGQYGIRMFSNNGFTQLAVSGSITIVASPASISLNGQPPPDNVSVIAGSHVSVGVSDGPANAGDWVGLFSGGAQDGQFLAWKYLNGSASLPDSGVPRADLSFAVPVSAGSYEFRFFSATASSGLGDKNRHGRLDIGGTPHCQRRQWTSDDAANDGTSPSERIPMVPETEATGSLVRRGRSRRPP